MVVSNTKKSNNSNSSKKLNTNSNKVNPTGLLNKKNVDNKKPLLSEEIMNIVSGASNIKKSIDPESMDYFGGDAKIGDSEDFGTIDDDDNSRSRLRGDIDSGFTSGKYSGKKASRKNESDEDEEFNVDEELPSEDDERDLDDVFDFDDKQVSGDEEEDDDTIVHSSNIDKADQLFKKLQQQQQSSDKESKEPKLLNITNEADEMEKAQNTKNQTVLYNEFLTTRIYLQKAINFANRLPKPKAYKEFSEYDEDIKNKFNQVKKASYGLVSELYNLQHELIEKNDEIPKSTSKKRIREESSLTDVWNIIDEQNQRLNEFHNATITKWNNRISITGTTSNHNKSLKSLNQSILTQINNTLNDIERLQKRTQLKRNTFKIFGDDKQQQQLNNNNNNIDNNNVDNINEDDQDKDEYDDEIFDDTDFYQNLLRELENNGDEDSNKVGSQYWIEMKNLKKKKKKKVNQKASKGRILRYEVFPKLENFMTPIQIPDSEWNIDQLYQNLFGGIGNK